MTTLLQHLDDLILVFWENLGETISLLNEIVLSSSGETTVDKLVRVVNLGTKSQHLASLLGNSNSITSQHLDGKTENLSFSDGGGGILTRRIEHGQHAEQLPWSLTFLDGNTEGTETTTSKLGGLCLVHVSILFGALGQVQDGLWCTLGADESNTILLDDGSDTLGDRIERSELGGGPALGEDILGFWVSLQGKNGDLIDWIEGLDVVGGSESGDGHHPVDIDTIGDERLTNGELIGGKGTSLVRAEYIDTLGETC